LSWFGDPVNGLGDYAGLLPGLALSIILALVLGGSVARRLGTTRIVATLLIVGLGAALSATITPSREALMGMPQISAGCDLSRIGLAPWWDYVHVDDASLNVLLFVPLGVAIGLMPRSRIQAGLILGSVLLPVAIETTQLVATPLGRACQSADVVDNLLGLVVGLGVGLTAAWIGQRA
jgi:glycopeptide antibiotics resistance protein